MQVRSPAEIQMTTEINEREQTLLKMLIESYVRDGQPVGSQKLARDSRLNLSPATVRNIMGDLEALGLVSSPHTSAGRIPTDKGYRLFVDSLLTVQSLDNDEVQRLKQEIDTDESVEVLIERVSSLLSGVTHMAGVVVAPRREHQVLRHIELLPLSDQRILVILVMDKQEVQNRIIRTAHAYTPSELQQVANYLNASLGGADLQTVRKRLLADMRETRSKLDRLMQRALDMAESVFAETAAQDDCVIAGQTNLMEFSELSDIDRLRSLFDAFNSKQQILHVLDQCLGSPGVQIFIGQESGYEPLNNCSLVTASYGVNNRAIGVLGVIGPTRMAYDRVISIVDATARLFSAVLNQRH